MGRKAREFIEPLRQQTGVVPAIFGALYPDWPDVFCTMQKADNLIISYAKKDGVIPLITWSANNPWNGNAYSDLNVPDFCEVNRPGTAAYAAFDAQLELIRASLMRMRKRGVTVLFRPLQEMNGDWFWWGNRNPEAFKKLWWRIYQRLAIDSGLDNLVWVYSAAAPTNVPVESLGAYYPGDAYVDVIGLSVYSDTMEAGDISSLLAIDKPFGFSEVGPAFWQNSGGYDGQVFVDTVRAAYPEVVFTMHWHSWVGAQMAIIDNPNPGAVLLDPWMVNASALPRW